MATEIQSTTQKMFGKQIDWDLLMELECPVCSDYMSSEIKMCENGHNICGGCKRRLSNCPSCGGMFVNVRNIALEKLATTAIYPCKNREAGCAETYTANGKGNHLAECLFQRRACPFRKHPGGVCAWTGTLSDIPVHIKDKHDSETAAVQGHFKVKLLDLSRGKRYHKAVHIMGELFYLSWEMKDDSFNFGAFYFGPKKETEAFKYGIKIGNSEEHVTVTRKCHNYVEGGPKDLQPEMYAKLYYNTIRNCLSESGDLSCEIEIGREKLDGFVLEESQECLQTVSVTDVGRDGSDNIATRDVLGSQQVRFRLGRTFEDMPTMFWGPTQPHTQMLPRFLWEEFGSDFN
jgi:E3 ubiquitin-protein ligase SIAH1